jgi:hypothetical protein
MAGGKPVPCPECRKSQGFEPCGPFRSTCNACGALLKNHEIAPPGQEQTP